MTEVLDLDFKNAFPGIFTVGILSRLDINPNNSDGYFKSKELTWINNDTLRIFQMTLILYGPYNMGQLFVLTSSVGQNIFGQVRYFRTILSEFYCNIKIQFKTIGFDSI